MKVTIRCCFHSFVCFSGKPFITLNLTGYEGLYSVLTYLQTVVNNNRQNLNIEKLTNTNGPIFTKCDKDFVLYGNHLQISFYVSHTLLKRFTRTSGPHS